MHKRFLNKFQSRLTSFFLCTHILYKGSEKSHIRVAMESFVVFLPFTKAVQKFELRRNLDKPDSYVQRLTILRSINYWI